MLVHPSRACNEKITALHKPAIRKLNYQRTMCRTTDPGVKQVSSLISDDGGLRKDEVDGQCSLVGVGALSSLQCHDYCWFSDRKAQNLLEESVKDSCSGSDTITGSAVALHCCKAHSKINRKMESSTPCKIVTPENFTLKFGTRDYVEEVTYYTIFDADRFSGGFSPNR